MARYGSRKEPRRHRGGQRLQGRARPRWDPVRKKIVTGSRSGLCQYFERALGVEASNASPDGAPLPAPPRPCPSAPGSPSFQRRRSQRSVEQSLGPPQAAGPEAAVSPHWVRYARPTSEAIALCRRGRQMWTDAPTTSSSAICCSPAPQALMSARPACSLSKPTSSSVICSSPPPQALMSAKP